MFKRKINLQMIKLNTILLFLFAIAINSCSGEKPQIIAPETEFETIIHHPSFSWKMPSNNDCSVQIQIAADNNFSTIIDEDKIHSVVDWYVPARALSVGTYWWRIRSVNDDGPNLTGNIFFAKSQESPKRFVFQTAISWQNPAWKIGDTLQFWNQVTGLPIGQTTINKVFSTKEDLKNGIHRVELQDDINVVTGMDMATSTQVYNLSCNNNNLVARNNRIDVSRRFGFFIKSRNVLVEKNHFSNLAASAIYFENIPAFWEGNASENVVIQNNLIENCSNTYKSFRNGCASGITINLQRYPGDPSNKDYETPWMRHKNFLIRRNEIIDWEYCGISIDNAENVEIYENTFRNKDKPDFMMEENIAISIGNKVKNIVVKGNMYMDKRNYIKKK